MRKAAENSANKSNGRPTLGESVISEASLEYNDPPEQIWIRVQDAVKLIYSENPKRHDFSALIQSIEKYGYQEKAKYDSTLNAIKAGNGRIEALNMMECEGTYKLPRGLAKHKESGEWCVPLDIGTNAFDRNEALGYLIDANNLTMLGGDFGMYDIAKMWDEKNYANILKELQDFEIPTISMDQDDIGAFLNTIESGNSFDAKAEWQGMPEFEQEEAGALKTLKVHFVTKEDIAAFAALMGQTVTMDTKYIWYPPKKDENLKPYKVLDES